MKSKLPPKLKTLLFVSLLSPSLFASMEKESHACSQNTCSQYAESLAPRSGAVIPANASALVVSEGRAYDQEENTPLSLELVDSQGESIPLSVLEASGASVQYSIDGALKANESYELRSDTNCAIGDDFVETFTTAESLKVPTSVGALALGNQYLVEPDGNTCAQGFELKRRTVYEISRALNEAVFNLDWVPLLSTTVMVDGQVWDHKFGDDPLRPLHAICDANEENAEDLGEGPHEVALTYKIIGTEFTQTSSAVIVNLSCYEDDQGDCAHVCCTDTGIYLDCVDRERRDSSGCQSTSGTQGPLAFLSILGALLIALRRAREEPGSSLL